MLLTLLTLVALLLAPALASAQTQTLQTCPGGRCLVPGGYQPPHSFQETPAEAAPPRGEQPPSPQTITREQLAQANAGYAVIVWYDKTDPRWSELCPRLQPGQPLRRLLEQFGRLGFRNLGDPRNAPYARTAGVSTITIHVRDAQFTGWQQIDTLLAALGDTSGVPTPAPVTPPATPVSDSGPPPAGPACDCDRQLCRLRDELTARIDSRLQQIEQRMEVTVQQFDQSLSGWQALSDQQTAQIQQLTSRCDERWQALEAVLPSVADNQQQLASLLARLDQIERQLAALEHKTDIPFEVELFSDGESVAGPRSVRPHGGYLPIDVSGVLEDAAPIP